MMMFRKIFAVGALAYFASQFLQWMLWDIQPGETGIILALVFACYILVRDLLLTLYIESKIDLRTMTPRE